MRIHQQGISLIEILLVLVVAAVIVSGAITYYSQTLTNSRVSQALTQLQQINKAGREWLQIPDTTGKYHADYSDLTGGQGLSEFIALGLISCENNSCLSNPWGGTTTVSADSAYARFMLVTFSAVPAADCARLREQMKDIASSGPSEQNLCGSSSGTTQYQIYL
jgi:Tfp pilus assembly protein PilV